MVATPSFADLIEQARQGNSDALAQLAREYEREVRVVARALLGPALRPYLDSIDLVQSIHRSLLVGLQQDKFDLSTPENLVALALTMVRRKVARHWRKLRRQKRLDATLSGSHGDGSFLGTQTAPTEDPAQTVEYTDQRDHLYEHLADAEQQILDMRTQGYTTREIADHLGISPVALRVRLTRLKQRLEKSGLVENQA